MKSSVTPVTIVGAGPTGLALAVELRRRGVACRVLEKSLRRTGESRALAVHARTLEAFEALGIAALPSPAEHRFRLIGPLSEGEEATSGLCAAPDRYVGYRTRPADAETVLAYLERLLA
jgi:2-polyprenyl-6-methoxyphenol hydroxylase-like FAD-dependent oxidoreductase